MHLQRWPSWGGSCGVVQGHRWYQCGVHHISAPMIRRSLRHRPIWPEAAQIYNVSESVDPLRRYYNTSIPLRQGNTLGVLLRWW